MVASIPRAAAPPRPASQHRTHSEPRVTKAGVDTPIQDIDALVRELEAAIDIVVGLCTDQGVDVIALRDANGFAHIALRDSAMEALLEQEETRTIFLAAARQVRRLFKALLPDLRAAAHQRTRTADRSVTIDFDALAAAFAGRKRAETDRLASLLKQRAAAGAVRNPTRYDLLARIEDLIAEYNAGSVNIDEYLRRLVALSKTLSEEEHRCRGPYRGRVGDLRPVNQA